MGLLRRKRTNRRVPRQRPRAPRAPAWMRPRLVRRVRPAVLALLALVLLAWQLPGLLPADLLPIRQVRVEGSFRHVSVAQIRGRVAPFSGKGFFSVNVARVAQAVESLPWVARAAVSRSWPDALEVRIREQKPVARWGSEGLLNADGRLFTTDASGEGGLPELHGPAGSEAEVLAAYRRASKVAAAAGLHLAALRRSRRGSWRARLAQGVGIRIGRGHPAAVLGHFIDTGLAAVRSQLPRIAYIDLRYPNGFAVADRTGKGDGQRAGKG
ncbi:MAG TPA: FtsQ-type POTRA domain-containing protein [Gammaproteobacteria bacterium]|nr:FtsQ-type POTRA domain-containing protein [Gammaproteobacteria bacterium]